MAGLDERLFAVIGGRSAKPLAEHLQISTMADLMQHYPRRYQSRGELTDLDALVPGEQATIVAEVRSSRTVPGRGGRRGGRVEAVVTDGRSNLNLTFFNQLWRARDLQPGRRGLFSGKVGEYRGKLQMANPQCHFADDADDREAAEIFAKELIPVYPATASLESPRIAKSVKVALEMLDPVPDPLPADLRAKRRLMSLDEALRAIHSPDDLDQVAAARHRLAYDEALGLQLVLAQRRQDTVSLTSQARPGVQEGVLEEFDRQLLFTLTDGQTEVGANISSDLAGTHPMHRLLQGDVGSGKTLVALRAMLQVVDSGGQAVLLAPTEVLAQQHYSNIVQLLGPLAEGGLLGGSEQGTRVALLTGSASAATRRAALLDIASGEAGVVVGTHALLQEGVHYADLGLIVVDEQHRFGVEQRSSLLDRVPGQRPHLLVMTATPIPRTVAMTVFGDLEVSTLRERPTGDSQVVTHVVAELEQPGYVDRMWQRVVEEVANGRQVFIVCPRISESDEPPEDTLSLDATESSVMTPTHSVDGLVTELREGPLSELRIEPLHGRLAAEEKEAVMSRFVAGPEVNGAAGLDVVVSTTVIEVGVDVPNAAMMVIMDADRFGVSQLHQLRGRVGRAGQDALCLLVTKTPSGSPANERLRSIAQTNDGFSLARLDLEQRREGDVLGATQSGRRSSLRLLSVLRDEGIITQARSDAIEIVNGDPELNHYPLLQGALADLKQNSEYLEKT